MLALLSVRGVAACRCLIALALSLLLGATHSPLAAQYCLDLPAGYGGGDLPRALAAGDLNGDGDLDLVVGSSSVSVLYADGLGGFGVPRSFATEWTADALALGDLDLDGDLDVLASRLGATLQQMVLSNDGGELLESLLSDPGSRHSSIGDFNGDGLPDFAANVALDHEIAVFLGNGAGAFTRTKGIFTFDVWQMESADLNGDNRLDLVTIAGSGSAIEVVVHLGDGLGGLAPSVAFPATLGGLALVDMNGDGVRDLVYGQAVVRLGDGAGGFGPVVATHAGGVSALQVDDYDGDGHLDVAVADDAAPVVTVLRGNGTGQLLAGVPVGPLGSGGAGIYRLVSGDFDGSGTPDLAHLSRNTGRLTLLNNPGLGAALLPDATHDLLSNRVTHFVTGDWNGDGVVDLAAGTGGNTGGTGYGVAVALGDGNGSWQSLVVLPTTGAVVGLAARDADGDANLDLLIAVQGTGVVLGVASGTGTFALADVWALPTINSLATLDADGDGDVDLLGTDTSGVSLGLGTGAGQFVATPLIAVAGAALVRVGDFDSDGNADLFYRSWDGSQARFWLHAGTATAVFQTGVSWPAELGSAVRIADLNEDGRDDIVVQPVAGAGYWRAGAVTGGVTAEQPLPGVGTSLSVVDIDNDGHLDLLVDDSVFRGDGTGAFVPGVPLGWNELIAEVISADLDGDGLPDLIGRSTTRPTLFVGLRGVGPCETLLLRGACNGDASVDVADAVWLFRSLFDANFPLGCPEACDVNQDDLVDMADGVQLLQFLFGVGVTMSPAPIHATCEPAQSIVLPPCALSPACP